MVRSSIPVSEQKQLCMSSGRYCAMPNCQMNLLKKTDNNKIVNISQQAHIVAISNNGPRADPTLLDKEKNLEKNLILLCANCHKIVDSDPDTYTIKKLLRMKSDQAEKMSRMIDGVSSIGFAELEVILNYLASTQDNIKEDYTLLPPNEKIEKNNLSDKVRKSISGGMVGATQVKKYFEKHPDPKFGNLVRNRLVQEYRKLHDEKYSLLINYLMKLWDYAAQHSNDFTKRMAALSVLVYFFETCEVFEK